MQSLTIPNLDDDVLDRLRRRAAANQRSVEAELREIITRAVRPLSVEEFFARADQIAAATEGRPQTDSAILQREDRDR